jgi:hypothetical protein
MCGTNIHKSYSYCHVHLSKGALWKIPGSSSFRGQEGSSLHGIENHWGVPQAPGIPRVLPHQLIQGPCCQRSCLKILKNG